MHRIIQAIHLKKAIDEGKLNEGDILIKVAFGKDFSSWEQLLWYQRKDLPDTLYWQEPNRDEDYKYRNLYIGPVKPDFSSDQLIEKYHLTDLGVGLKYLIVGKLDIIDGQPVVAMVDIIPLKNGSN